MSDGDRLFISGVPGQGASEFLDLCNGALVPCAKTLDRERQEDNSLVMAGLPGLVHLSLMGDCESVAWLCCSPCHKTCLQGVDDSNVEGCVLGIVRSSLNISHLIPTSPGVLV